MLGAFYVLLQRYTGQNDINVGTPIANRNQYQVEGLIGFFVNTLVMRLQLTEQTTFNALLAQIKQTALAAYANQDVPFEKLVEVLQPERQMNRSPLFQVMFVLDNNPLEWDLAGLKIAPVDVELAIAKFDLTISFREWQGKLAGWIEYDTDLFTEATIVRIAQHYRKLLQSILADPSQPIGRLAMLAASERQQLLEEWNQTAAPYPNLSVTELLEAQIAATPQNIAVECREKTLTYQELNIAANKVAHYLRALGVKPQQIVGIYLDRSLEMVIAILAVLKAGGAYLPIDISYPQERVDFMLQDAAVQAVLTRSSLSAQLGQNTAKVICLDTDEAILTSEQIVNPTIVNRPADLVYLIYTSGSTGRPKGVMIEHQGLVNYLTWAVDYYRVAEAQGAPLHSSISFDLTVTSFYTPLLTGKQIVLLPEAETIDVLQQLATMLSTRNFSTLKITPAHLNVLRELLATTKIHTGPQVIVIGGEALYGEDLVYWQQQLPDTRLINEYGPTETVVGCVVYEATTKSTGSLPIGRPIANTAIYILNTQLEPLPVGVIGEVYIGGDGVARGYLNREDLTAERFLPDPFRQQPAKMYKTGDLARYLPDGNIEYVGRIDDQVKLRGYRIELGEIAATINQYSGIQESVVVVNSGPEKQLIAYLVASPELSIAELRSYLKQQLPEYMLPVAYVKLASIPLTPNGKVDRKALPDVEQGDYARREYVAPNSFMEKKLAEIYCEVLKVKQIGIADNFFELGGHSLLATQVISRLRTELALDVQLRWIFEFPQLGQLAAELEHLHSNLSQSPILPIGREKPLPLSFAQERLWFLDQLTPDSPFYNLPAVLRVQGDLDQEILRASFQIVVDRHEILRTTFKLVDGRPTQIVETKLKVTIPIVDLTSIAASNRESEALQLVSVETHQSFELSTLPLMRVKLLQLAAQEYWLIITLHHIISDGWSGNVLLTELRQIYTTLKQTAAYQAAPLPIQYADFAYWQRQWLQGEVLEQQLNYWREKLRGVEMLELPTDRPRPTTSRFQGRHYSLSLDAKLVNELRQLSIKQDTTLFMTLLAAFEVLLQRYSRQNDISVGTPIANRTRQEVENLIGFFVNTLVMRANVQGEQRFVDFLAQVKTTALEAYANQDVPFEKLVEALQPQRQLNRSPLFQVMFVMGNMATDTVSWDGVTLTPQAVELTIAKFDLTLFAQEIPTGLLTLWEYDTDLFDQETVARIAAQYEILLHSIVANPQELVGRLSLLTEAERQKILIQWNQTTAAYPQDQCLPELLEAQVARTPDAVAVEYEGQTLTYTELNQRANKVAFYLREISVGPESLVALSLERCLDLVVGIVGILKAGAAYLPIDPTYPVDRIKFMLEDAAVSVLVTNQQQDTVLPKLDGLVRIRLDQDWEVINCRSGENPPLTANPDNLAYVIYTSGSTGRPKGAMIHHRGLMNYLTWAIDFYQVADGEGSPLHSSISFDLTITSLFPALLTGKRVVLTKESEGIEGLQQLARSLREHQNLSLLKITPAHLNVMRQLLAPEAAPNRTRVMVIGGEALYAEELAYWREHAPNTRLINEYGPTETVVGCCVYEVPQQEALRPGGVLIGRPIANTTLYILNEQLEPMPIGVPGELYIGGDGVARGYLNRPELTAERFLANPFSANSEAKIYRTGDLARYLPDGNIEYIGRIDDQVKVRGYRIELGEVEAVLNQHPAVRKGLVMIKDDIQEGKRLVAYVTAHFMLDRIPWQASCLLELENGEKIRLLTEDISDSGACLTGVETFLRKNERAKLILALPEEETFIINGIIAWQHGKRTGVKFDVTSDEIKQLRRTIEKINKQQGFSVYDFRLFQRADTRLPMNVPCMVEFNDGQTVSANTQNISSSGLGLVNLPLGNKIAGQMVRVQVFLPGMGEYIWLNGKVAWQISDRCGLMIKPTSAERMLIHQTMDYIASSTGFSITHLRDFLKNKLPAYMVPAAFIVLDTLPLTQNGKLDRSALAAAEWIRPELDKPFSAPRNSIEERLARIFGEVLNLEKVSIHDNFFEIGGHSILVTQLIARIHEVFPVTLPVRQFFETPTVAGIADLLDVVCWLGQEYDTEKPKVESLDLYKEAVLEPIISGENVGFTTAQPGNIFLAGATGFLGSFILWELLRQTESTVYCLVASAGPEEGKEKIQREMENYELWNGRLSNRIIAIPGSFSQPKFGLLDEQFNILSTLIDTIYYAGASVNYVAPYSIMKEINVIGVQEVLRLASQFKLKPVHYVSSISVFSASDFTANSEVSEYDEPNFPQELTTGYAQSRWVAEKLVVAARQRKIPVSLYRQGRITGDSQTGIASVDDVIFRLIKGFIQLQSAPILNNLIVEMVPVDYTAKALVHLSRQTDLIGKNFHLTNANCIKYLDLVGWMRAYGYNLELIPAEKWLNQAKMRTTVDDPLYPILSVLDTIVADTKPWKINCEQTQQLLKNLSVECPSVDDSLLRTYFGYLIQSGFLTKPHS
jgi:amino acid adenylation domain-containing protein/thioester reductase-like protein